MLNKVGTAVVFNVFFEAVANISFSKWALQIFMFRYKYPASFVIRSFRLVLIAHFLDLICKNYTCFKHFCISFPIPKNVLRKRTNNFTFYKHWLTLLGLVGSGKKRHPDFLFCCCYNLMLSTKLPHFFAFSSILL